MAGDQPAFRGKQSAESDRAPAPEAASSSPFGGILDLLGKARTGIEKGAHAAAGVAEDLAHKAPGVVSDAVKNAPKIGDHIDNGANAVNRALKSAPEPVRNIAGETVTGTMRSAADLTRLPADIQKHGMSPDVARRAAGDLAGVGSAAIPGLGAPAAGVLGHVIKKGVADQVMKQATGGTVKDHVSHAAADALCGDQHQGKQQQQRRAEQDKGQASGAEPSAADKARQYGCAVNEGLSKPKQQRR